MVLGEKVPTWSLNDKNGEAVHQEAYLGKAVLLEFWSATCGACIASMPELAEFAKKHQQDVTVILVNADETASDPEKFAALQGTDMVSLHDPLGVTFSRYAVPGTPTFVLIDAKGHLVHRHIGVASTAALEAQLHKI